jgi:hypothetical protein
MATLLRRLLRRLIEPFLIAQASVREVAWGASVGILTALLPLFGVQLYVALGLWLLSRWASGRTFNLPVCFAVSWVMNPLTVVPIYYVYYLTGDTVWDALTVPTPDWTFSQFEELFLAAIAPASGVWWERFFGGMLVLFDFFGWPILLGSLIWALPASVLAHIATRWALVRYRQRRSAAGLPAAGLPGAAAPTGGSAGDPFANSA